jgi:uncharacterized repeat protein (TIGR01451 family)
VGDLNSGATATLTLNCNVNAGQGGNTITNTIVSGDLSMDQTEGNAANDGSSASTTINNITDVAFTKTGPLGSQVALDIVYTITATNNGPNTATSVMITDNCPAGTTYNAAGTSATEGAYAAGVWNLGTLENGDTETLTLACTVDAGEEANTITNSLSIASLSMDQADTNTGNNVASVSTLIADVGLGGVYAGDEFWTVIPRNLDQGGSGPCFNGDCIVTVQGEVGTTVVVNGVTTVIPAAGQFTQVMSEANDVAPVTGISSTAPFEITADDLITVFVGNALSQPTSSGTLILPVFALGQTYYSIGEPEIQNNVPALTFHQIIVVATEDTTTINVDGDVQVLDEGESYSYRENSFNNDITGRLITADKPIAVFTSNPCLDTIVGSGACDATMVQLEPFDLASDTEFLFGGFSIQDERVKCVAIEDTTSITLNGVAVPGTFDAGDVYQVANNTVAHIQADKPLTCGVMLIGGAGQTDPAYSALPGINHGVKEASYPVPTPFLNGNMTVMVRTADTGSFLYDGGTLAGWTAFPSKPSWSYNIINITAGAHTLEADTAFIPLMAVRPVANAAYATVLGALW